jgi:hypothetical protein
LSIDDENQTMKPSTPRQRLFSLFERAAQRGWHRRLREVLHAIGDVHAVDRQGRTLLMIAAAYGRIEAVQLLLDAGADVHVADSQGMTPLMHAAEAGKRPFPGTAPIAVARVLLAAGSDPTRRCQLGWTAEEIALFWEAHMMFVAPERKALARLLRSACRSFRSRQRQSKPIRK